MSSVRRINFPGSIAQPGPSTVSTPPDATPGPSSRAQRGSGASLPPARNAGPTLPPGYQRQPPADHRPPYYSQAYWDLPPLYANAVALTPPDQTQDNPARLPVAGRRSLLNMLPGSGGQGRLHLQMLEAAERGNLAQIDELLGVGANINAVSSDRGRTVLHKVFKHRRATEQNIQFVRQLLERGANLQIADNERKTPLALALKNRWLRTEAVRAMLADHYPGGRPVLDQDIKLLAALLRVRYIENYQRQLYGR